VSFNSTAVVTFPNPLELTKDEIKVIWLALHNYSPYDPKIACGLSENRQEEIASDIRAKIFSELTK
jgi:hypothetical protein